MSNEKEKPIYIFIDASNLWGVYKSKGRFLNFEKTISYIKKNFSVKSLKVFYYTAYPAENTRSYSLDKRHKFYTYLQKGLSFNVIKKKLKRIHIAEEEGERIEEKGDMDVEITVDALHHLDKYDKAIFFTGDSDFLALISYLRNHDKKVFIFSSENNISEELRTGGNGYTDITKIDNIWGKRLKHREELEKENN